jgi:hypothetical protein
VAIQIDMQVEKQMLGDDFGVPVNGKKHEHQSDYCNAFGRFEGCDGAESSLAGPGIECC